MDKKLIAEFIGTFTLAFAVLLSLGNASPLPTPLIAALVLTLFVYSIGAISGSHMNPAVTIGLWSIKKIPLSIGIKYIVVQFLGAAVASMAAKNLGVIIPPQSSYVPLQSLLMENLGTILFTFGIASVVYRKVPDAASGLVVGGSLLLGITIASLGGSAGILNPAVALSLGVPHLLYYIVQVIGATIGFQLYSQLMENRRKLK